MKNNHCLRHVSRTALGLSIIELMLVLALTAIISAAFISWGNIPKRTQFENELANVERFIQYAAETAIQSSTTIIVCPINTDGVCDASGGNKKLKWNQRLGLFGQSNGKSVLITTLASPPPLFIRTGANRDKLSFYGSPMNADTGRIRLCEVLSKGSIQMAADSKLHGAVVIGRTMKLRKSKEPSDVLDSNRNCLR